MTSEMQLAHAAGLPVAGVNGNGNGSSAYQMAAPPPPPPAAGFKKIHRILRGRYPLVLGVGLALGLICGMIGFFSKEPMYQSSGRIYLSPTIPSARTSVDPDMPGYATFVHSQAAVIDSRDMVELAMKNPKWKALPGKTSDDAAIDDFYTNLDVEEMPNTSLIKISYSDPDPNAAKVGAEVMCMAFQDFYEQQDPLLLTHKINQIDAERSRAGNDLQNLQAQLSEYSNKYGTDDLNEFAQSQMEQLAHLQAQLVQAEQDYKEAQVALAQADKGDSATRPGTLTDTQIASLGDQQMRTMIYQRSDLQRMVDQMKADGYGENHPKLQSMENDLQVMDNQIQAYVDDFNHKYRVGPGGNGGAYAVNLQSDLDAKRQTVDLLKDQADKQDQLVHEIGQQKKAIQDVQSKIEDKERELDSLNRDFDQLNSQKSLMQGQLEIISAPSVPTEPAHDRRLQFGLLGFVGGGLLPALIAIAIGLIDRRLRFSDETNSDLSGVHLLGILPNLPDLLTDPDQAATAAHCVHQIRTILQITGHSLNRRVFTVTSGSPGDGKTSLTLALGLSFAASGSRTLLIDGDLVGGGLTARLAVTADHGVLEAMASRDILPLIRSTDVTDLSLLPVGRAMGGYTGSIAPASVRRLIEEAKKHFDVVIIDTGPILGSIEASPMAVAADGVVLCVSRGQQRQLVDRAISHLHAIGARLSGVVFNRAQARDFDHSVSRMSLTPIGGANGNGARIGPVVTAVASSVRSGLGAHDEHG
jgi:capsular exopolysaccharide synthesis family protein